MTVSAIIECCVFKIVLDEISNIRSSKIFSNISLLIFFGIVIIMKFSNVNLALSLIIYITIMYIYCIYNYDISTLKGLLISLGYWLTVKGFNVLSSKLIYIISIKVLLSSERNELELFCDNIMMLELVILSKLFLISMIPIIKSINVESEKTKKDYIYSAIIILVNMICIITLFGFILKAYLLITNFALDVIIVSVSAMIFLSSILLVSLTNRIINDNRLRAENKAIRQNIDSQYKYYLSIKESQLKVRKLYHDMKNHMICIENIYGNNSYTKEINSKLEECNYIYNTGNMVLDVILNDKKTVCDKDNIDFYVDINFSKCEFIDISDVCSIFSNMIDNAIQACNKINDEKINKNIKIRGTIVNRIFVIQCENTKINIIKFRGRSIITDKKDSFLHGIGINSIKNSVQRYNGNLEIDTSVNKFIMTIYIPLIEKMTC